MYGVLLAVFVVIGPADTKILQKPGLTCPSCKNTEKSEGHDHRSRFGGRLFRQRHEDPGDDKRAGEPNAPSARHRGGRRTIFHRWRC